MSQIQVSRRKYRQLRCLQNAGSFAGVPCKRIVEYKGLPCTVVDADSYGGPTLKPAHPRDWVGPALLEYIEEAAGVVKP